MEKVSIIMAAYNAEITVKATIESLINQTYKNIEIIVVNDGSKDKTIDILNELANKYTNLIIIDQENAGPGKARNAAMEIAVGKYFMFIDADDFYSVNMVERMVKEIKSENYDLCNCGFKNQYLENGKIKGYKDWVKENSIYSSKKEILNNIDDYIASGLFNSMCNKIYKSEIIKEKGIRVLEGSDMGEDLCFNILYIDECKSVSIIDEPLYIYRIDKTKGLTSSFRKDEFNKRKVNLKMLGDLYEKNGLNKNRVYFEYIMMSYSCFSHLFSKRNKNTYKENLKYIEEVIDSNSMKNAIKEFKASNIVEFISLNILKSRFKTLIYFVSYILYLITKR